MKVKNIYKGLIKNQSDFSKKFSTWANNHGGWRKMKKDNKRSAKRKLEKSYGRIEQDFLSFYPDDCLTFKLPNGEIECNNSKDDCFYHHREGGKGCWECEFFIPIIEKLYYFEHPQDKPGDE